MPAVSAEQVKDELSFGATALDMSQEQFNTLLEGKDSDETDDGLIGREQERLVDEIDVALGVETLTETLSRPNSVEKYDLPLPNRPVQSVTSVSIATDRVGGSDITADDYIVHETHLELLPDAARNSWPTERRAITVEYDHGYPTSEIPEPIRAALIGLVRAVLQEIEADGIESESIAGDSVSYELRDDVVARHLGRARRFDKPDYYGGAQVV
jgi:hypothetical protein